MSSMDGSPVWVVEAEHLEDRRIRFWLHDDARRLEVCTLDGVSGCYPIVHRAVRELLALPDGHFRVSLRIPRPPYVVDGDFVTVHDDHGSHRGRIAGWGDSSVLVSAVENGRGGGGLFPPERLTYEGPSSDGGERPA